MNGWHITFKHIKFIGLNLYDMKTIFAFSFLLCLAFPSLAQPTYYGPNYLHRSSVANCILNWTNLDVSVVGSDPASPMLFTHVYGTPEGTHQAYMVNSCGLWFYSTNSNWTIFDETETGFNVDWAFYVIKPTHNGTAGSHVVTSGNLFYNFTLIDDPLLNNNPLAVFFISKTWELGVYDLAHVGIWYSESDGKWTIYNEDNTGTLQLNSTYNYFIPDVGTTFFKHVAASDNYITYLDHPLLNGNPYARMLVVHDYTNATGQMGYINSELGVWYDGSHWTIYTEDTSPLFIGATFNVLIMGESNTAIGQNRDGRGKVEVFPNPAKEQITIGFDLAESGMLSIDVYNSFGQHIQTVGPKECQRGHQTLQLDISGYTNGNYYCKIRSADNSLVTKFTVVK